MKERSRRIWSSQRNSLTLFFFHYIKNWIQRDVGYKFSRSFCRLLSFLIIAWSESHIFRHETMMIILALNGLTNSINIPRSPKEFSCRSLCHMRDTICVCKMWEPFSQRSSVRFVIAIFEKQFKVYIKWASLVNTYKIGDNFFFYLLYNS